MLNENVDDTDICAKFLQVLPKDFDNIYITWRYFWENLDEVTKEMLEFWVEIEQLAMETENEVVFISITRKRDTSHPSVQDEI